ncbi:hypothetical protein TMatcc_008393 [Talaromyces marneffei ATCC 18224]|uniref:Uncharacterized protein n=1 Tax=Talaromyces marneffei (strain ATCC 18224 / CBS 334.59 / QM 7333) TaxID=441960 RepID=B6QM46_TALMQ|nr:uncharacterized protein EYB26_007737 [Talaromyces marneffei]EEA22173.1 conserved hypothetical protein [Talaromyces marneffei ATCC 18224]QGA20037.1 hypothetical protein EYB26_007737 [Talaromyces marneffei]
MSSKWNDPDPGFVALSQFTFNPYRDAPFVSHHLMSPVTPYREPFLSLCPSAEPTPKSEPEHQPEHQPEPGHEPEHESESEPSPPQEIKHEIPQTTFATLFHDFANGRPSTSLSSNGYIDEYGCIHFSDTAETVESLPYTFHMGWGSQSSLPMVGGITHGADGLITTQIGSNGDTAGYFSIFPTSYKPQQPSYGTASYETASYGNALYEDNAYDTSTYANPYSTTAYDLASIQDTTEPHMGLGYSRQYDPYSELAAQMQLPASTMPGLTTTTPSMTRSSIPASDVGASSTVPVTPDCSLRHSHASESGIPPGSPLRGGGRPHRGTTFYRCMTPPHQSAGTTLYMLGYEQDGASTAVPTERQKPVHVRGASRDSNSGISCSSRASSSPSSGASPTGYHRQTVLESIPLHKLRAMQKVPLPAEGDNLAKDRYIVKGKQLKLSYGQIKAIADWPDAESTLRGRFRNFTKAKHERVRKPIWLKHDKEILIDVVLDLSEDLLNSMPTRRGIDNGHYPGKRYTVATLPEGIENHISWRVVANLIIENGGSYKFGSSTAKRKWYEMTGRQRRF